MIRFLHHLRLYFGQREKAIKALEKRDEKRVLETSPSLPLGKYVGTYQHEMLGNVKVSVSENKLHINFNDYLFYKTEHWHFDTFITNKDPKWRFELLVSFSQDQSGKIKALEAVGVKVAARCDLEERC